MKLDDGTLVLARTQSGDQDASLSLMESTDSGATWNTLAAGSVIRGVGGGFLPVVFPNGRVFATARNGSIGLSLAAGSTELLQFSVSGLLGAVLDVQFADDKHGWALVTESRCAGFKTDCWSLNYIEQTDDGGITWGPP